MAEITKRQTKNGDIRYKVVIRKKGSPTQTATFKRLTDAKRWERSVESAIEENRHYLSSDKKAITFAKMVDDYLAEIVPVRHTRKQSQQAVTLHLNWWKQKLGNYLLLKVTSKEISHCRNLLLNEPTCDSNGRPLLDDNGAPKKTKGPATVARYMASLSVVYSTAINEWGWLEVNPVKKVAKPAEPRGRARFLSDDERERLLEACEQCPNPILYTIVVVALSTGARKNEILTLEWRQIDFERNVIRLENTKNGERRALPLVGKAYDLVQDLKLEKSRDTDYVFPRPDGKKPVDIKRSWLWAIEKAEIRDFTFHDLRHTAASYLAMNGATLAEIAEILGHKTLQMVKRYAHMSEQHTISVVERMNKKIF